MEVGERQKIVIQTLYCSQWQFLVCRRSSQIRGDLAAYRPYSIRTRIDKEVNLSFKQKNGEWNVKDIQWDNSASGDL